MAEEVAAAAVAEGQGLDEGPREDSEIIFSGRHCANRPRCSPTPTPACRAEAPGIPPGESKNPCPTPYEEIEFGVWPGGAARGRGARGRGAAAGGRGGRARGRVG